MPVITVYENYRQDLADLEFLTMCIKEGMRLHCPVPMVGRQIQTELDIGDRVLPKDTTLTVIYNFFIKKNK